MRARLITLVGFIVVGIGLLGPHLGVAQEKLDPIKWSVKAETPAGALKPGDKFTVLLTAKIENGWHLYSPDQQPGGPIPTRIALPDNQPFKLAAEIESPLPRIELDPNFNLETQFYEGEATFTLPVKIAANAQPGKQEVKVNVSYQTCNGEICLPPKRLKLAAEIDIKKQ